MWVHCAFSWKKGWISYAFACTFTSSFEEVSAAGCGDGEDKKQKLYVFKFKYILAHKKYIFGTLQGGLLIWFFIV